MNSAPNTSATYYHAARRLRARPERLFGQWRWRLFDGPIRSALKRNVVDTSTLVAGPGFESRQRACSNFSSNFGRQFTLRRDRRQPASRRPLLRFTIRSADAETMSIQFNPVTTGTPPVVTPNEWTANITTPGLQGTSGDYQLTLKFWRWLQPFLSRGKRSRASRIPVLPRAAPNTSDTAVTISPGDNRWNGDG